MRCGAEPKKAAEPSPLPYLDPTGEFDYTTPPTLKEVAGNET